VEKNECEEVFLRIFIDLHELEPVCQQGEISGFTGE